MRVYRKVRPNRSEKSNNFSDDVESAMAISNFFGFHWKKVHISNYSAVSRDGKFQVLAMCRGVIFLSSYISSSIILYGNEKVLERVLRKDTYLIRILAEILIHIIIIVMTFKKSLSNLRYKIIDLYQEVDNDLRRMNCDLQKPSQIGLRYNSGVHVLSQLAWIFLNSAIIIYTRFYLKHAKYVEFFRSILTTVISITTIFDFGFFVNSGTKCLHRAYLLLVDLSLDVCAKEKPYVQLTKARPSFERSIIRVSRAIEKTHKDIESELQHIAKLVFRIFQAKNITGSLCQFRIVAVIMDTFLLIIFVAYFICVRLFLKKTEYAFVDIILSLLYLVLYYWKIYKIVVVCARFERETKRIKRILKTIINKTNNSTVETTATLLYLQMRHSDSKFTGCGLFPLDYTLFVGIVGSTATYMMILLQFALGQ